MIYCFFQHNKEIVKNNNESQIVLFDKTSQLTACFADENKNEQIYKNDFETVYKTNSHNVKHIHKYNMIKLLNMNVAHVFSIMNHK